MSTRPKRRKLVPPKASNTSNWRELRARFTDVMKDVRTEIGRSWKYEGKQLGRGLKAKLLPPLKRARRKIEGLIARIEKRPG